MSLSKLSPVLGWSAAGLAAASFALSIVIRRQRLAQTRADLVLQAGTDSNKERVAVDGVFFARLSRLLKISVGSPSTMGTAVFLTLLLFARTWTTLRVSNVLSEVCTSRLLASS